MNISIIGAGPIGCYCGYLLAKSGHKVSIYEEHAEIGLPIQCTGLLTSDFEQFNLPLSSFLVNTFSEVEVNSPNGQKVIIPQKEYLVDRHKFDSYLAQIAKKAGAEIFLHHSFSHRDGKKLILLDTLNRKEISIDPDIIIIADGPLSKTAHSFGLYHKNRINYYGIQAIVEGNFSAQRYHTYFGTEVCPELFAWIVPESTTLARVGLATTSKPRKYFDKFISAHGFKVKQLQAGTIPLYHPQQKLHTENVYLLGDASGFVKATTLGGIIPGMKQAQILTQCICENKDYEKATSSLKKRLKLHLRLRKLFNKFQDSDWDRLIAIMAKPKMQRLLQQHTREAPLPIVFKALLQEPRLWRFGKFLF